MSNGRHDMDTYAHMGPPKVNITSGSVNFWRARVFFLLFASTYILVYTLFASFGLHVRKIGLLLFIP